MLLIFFLIGSMTIAQSQDFSSREQYNQLMGNAKVAMDASRYSEALYFYKEALRLFPDAKLPKYKIEDIRTIYIKEVLEKAPLAEKPKKEPKSLKERKPKKKQPEKNEAYLLAEKEADKKMEEDAALVKQEISQWQMPVKVEEIGNDSIEIDEPTFENAEPDRMTGLSSMERKKADVTILDKSNENREVNIQKRDITAPLPEPMDTVAPVKESKPEALKAVYKPKPVQNGLSEKERLEIMRAELERLAKEYPNRKTVENIEKPGKKITRVIMNINNNVSIYLEVKHDWGAVFYFQDKPGFDLISIDQRYFNQMTNLEHYD